MRHHCLHWIHPGIAFLLVLNLPACVRSARTFMTPLPSMPPPTATMAVPPLAQATMTRTVTATATFNPTREPTETEAVTPSPQAASPTATQAVPKFACGNALPTRLQLGSYAYVDPEPPLPNNLRSAAGKDNTLIGDIQPGQAMKILEGPKCADGWVWWKVQTLETDLVGWTAEGDEQDYWLIPCASESECAP